MLKNDFFGFPKVKWLHLKGEVDKSVRFSCQIFSRFNVIIKSVNFWQSYSKNKKVDVFGDTRYIQTLDNAHSSQAQGLNLRRGIDNMHKNSKLGLLVKYLVHDMHSLSRGTIVSYARYRSKHSRRKTKRRGNCWSIGRQWTRRAFDAVAATKTERYHWIKPTVVTRFWYDLLLRCTHFV